MKLLQKAEYQETMVESTFMHLTPDLPPAPHSPLDYGDTNQF